MPQAERFLLDEQGRRVAVVLEVAEYERLLAQAEELEVIRAYDAAKAAGDVAVPLDDALREIERRKDEPCGLDPSPRSARARGIGHRRGVYR
jgi:hypothetical protein